MAIFILVDNVSELLTLPDRVSVSIRSSICHKRKFASIDRMIFTHAINDGIVRSPKRDIGKDN